jgi:hypothetical protein
MMRLQPVGKNYKKIHGILKKQMAGALLGMRKYQKTALDIHKPVKPETAALNEAFGALVAEHAGEWGTDELRSNYQVQTPGQPVTNFKAKEEPQLPIEEPAPASNSDYMGQTLPMANSSGPATPTRSAYSGLSEHVQKWASNNNTIERFKARYGNLWEAKILETAVFLDKQKLEDQPRSLRMVQEALKKPGNDTFLNNKSKKIIKRKQ